VDKLEPERIATLLGKAQRRTILSLTNEWGKAVDHRCARRMFWGTRGSYLVDHSHGTDNCWRLTQTGLAVKDALARATLSSNPDEERHK
jgi:hypothetical protein